MDDFDYIPVFGSSAAPELPEYEEQPRIEKNPKQSKASSAARAKASARRHNLVKLFAIVSAAVIILSMLSAVTWIDRQIISNNEKIENLNKEILQAEAESVRLNAALGALVSADKIQEYAVSVLGMQKVESYQIHYFETRGKDEVVVAGGKAVEKETKAVKDK